MLLSKNLPANKNWTQKFKNESWRDVVHVHRRCDTQNAYFIYSKESLINSHLRQLRDEALPEDQLFHRTDTGCHDAPALPSPVGKERDHPKLFDDVKERLDVVGLIMHGSTIVDATIIHAPSSTKNATKTHDPEMHSVRKGNQWFFGMKIHLGADAATGYVYMITGTAANVHDIVQTHALIRADDHIVYGDSGYTGVEKRAEIRENPHLSRGDYRIAQRPSQNRITKAYAVGNWDRKIEHMRNLPFAARWSIHS